MSGLADTTPLPRTEMWGWSVTCVMLGAPVWPKLPLETGAASDLLPTLIAPPVLPMLAPGACVLLADPVSGPRGISHTATKAASSSPTAATEPSATNNLFLPEFILHPPLGLVLFRAAYYVPCRVFCL